MVSGTPAYNTRLSSTLLMIILIRELSTENLLWCSGPVAGEFSLVDYGTRNFGILTLASMAKNPISIRRIPKVK